MTRQTWSKILMSKNQRSWERWRWKQTERKPDNSYSIDLERDKKLKFDWILNDESRWRDLGFQAKDRGGSFRRGRWRFNTTPNFARMECYKEKGSNANKHPFMLILFKVWANLVVTRFFKNIKIIKFFWKF